MKVKCIHKPRVLRASMTRGPRRGKPLKMDQTNQCPRRNEPLKMDQTNQCRHQLDSFVGILPKFSTKKPRTKTKTIRAKISGSFVHHIFTTTTTPTCLTSNFEIENTVGKKECEKPSSPSSSSSLLTLMMMPLCDPGPIPDLSSIGVPQCFGLEEFFASVPDF
ncbi:hypothetical protein Ancab_013796 [Ancistrocladus abbreviatus]